MCDQIISEFKSSNESICYYNEKFITKFDISKDFHIATIKKLLNTKNTSVDKIKVFKDNLECKINGYTKLVELINSIPKESSYNMKNDSTEFYVIETEINKKCGEKNIDFNDYTICSLTNYNKKKDYLYIALNNFYQLKEKCPELDF